MRWFWTPTVFLLAAWLSRWPVLYRSVLDWDESLYYLMARAWLAGHLPYTVIWDNKPPGIYAIFALASGLFGGGVGAIRLATVLCVCALATLVHRIVESLSANRGAAWAGGALLLLASMSNDGLAANTELFMAAFTAAAVLAALTTRRGFLVGLLLGAAFMVKYVSVLEAPAVIGLFLWRTRGLRPAGLLLLGAATPLLAVVLLYLAAGALPVFWADAVRSNFRRAGAPLTWGAVDYALRLQALRWGTLYAVAGLCWCWPAMRRAPYAWFLAFWLAGGLLGAAAAKSFYDHYFLQPLPALCVIAAVAGSRIPGRLQRAALGLALATPPALAAQTALAAAVLPDEPRAAAAAIGAAGAGSLYVFDTQPILYALTGLPPPTQFVLPSVLTGPLLPAVAGVDPVAELHRILSTSPQFIARRAGPPTNALQADLNAALAAHYEPFGLFGDIAIYRLRGGTQAAASMAAKRR